MSDKAGDKVEPTWGIGRHPGAPKNAKPSIWVSNGDSKPVVLASFKSNDAAVHFLDLFGAQLADGIPPERLADVVSRACQK